MVEFLFKKSSLYNTSCNESTTPSLAEYFLVYLNVESAERRGDRHMSSSLPSTLLYFPVIKYLYIKMSTDHVLEISPKISFSIVYWPMWFQLFSDLVRRGRKICFTRTQHKLLNMNIETKIYHEFFNYRI